MTRDKFEMLGLLAGLALAVAVAAPHAAFAQPPGKIDPDGLTMDGLRAAMPEYFHPSGSNPRVSPTDIPDVFGPGAVLRVGNVYMKVTNWGHNGNLFTNVSSDPSGSWPGASAVEYLSSMRLSVGAVNAGATDPNAVRRVSYLLEWRPQTLEPDDKIYRAYDGIVNGSRYVNDDNDFDSSNPYGCATPPCAKIDEDFLDGRDNDGDGQIDEDFGALGQEMYSLVMWDNTIQAINTVFAEKHVPLGLECRQRAWAYSVIGFQDFNVVEYEIINRSGHVLDSLCIGWLLDIDSGPVELSNFFNDDFDVPTFPQGEFLVQVGSTPGQLIDPLRRQQPHDTQEISRTVYKPDSALCPVDTIRVNGFSVIDDDGDVGRTTGVGSFLLIDHTVDPLGETGPKRVGFRAYRSFTGGTPYAQGGNPVIDQQRFEFMSGQAGTNIGEDGFINALPGDQKGDYIAWASVGPWLHVADGQSIFATVAFAVQRGNYQDMIKWPTLLEQYKAAPASTRNKMANDLFGKYPALYNAYSAQLAFAGVHEKREGYPTPDFHGRETPRQLSLGAPTIYLQDCRDVEKGQLRPVTEREPTWFDFDCSYCTGVWDYTTGAANPQAGGLFHKAWNAEAPPPNPTLNVASRYNFSDNPNRKVVPAGDNAITLAWDNLSEVTQDPKSQWFDFRGYKVWKVSDWLRPVGSAGPSEADWTLLGEFRQFRYELSGVPITTNRYFDPDSNLVCPKVFIPNYRDTVTGIVGPRTVPVCLDIGDLWDHQSGQIIKPDTTLEATGPGQPGCIKDSTGRCIVVNGCTVHRGPCETPSNREDRLRYPVGTYRYVDREVKNGFSYFYAVTAFDSTTTLGRTTELGGRRSAVEAEGVVPQTSVGTGKKVWVVPNPYRGYARIADRPSAWDLTPNASDPTGTHIDFLGLPTGKWTIRVYTVSGDLVAQIRSEDAVNESVRPAISDGVTSLPGYNRQQDNSSDGQARWNLISRNGQDIVSGIYLFTVESNEGTQRGRFVVIR